MPTSSREVTIEEPPDKGGTLSLLAGTTCLLAFVVWLYTSGPVATVFGVVAAVSGVVLLVAAVVGAIVAHRPGVVLLAAGFCAVGVLLTAVVFGFVYLDDSIDYVRGETTTAHVDTCVPPPHAGCRGSWEVDGQRRSGRIELSFGADEGRDVPVRAHGATAVRSGGLTLLVVVSSGIAAVSPILLVGGALLVRRRR